FFGADNRPKWSTANDPARIPVWITITVAAEPMSGDRKATPVTYMAPSTPPNHIHHGFLRSPEGTLTRNDGLVATNSSTRTPVPTTKDTNPAWMAESRTPAS